MASDRPSKAPPQRTDENRSRRDPSSAPESAQALQPGLYIVATPIGNLRDITLRALDILGSVDEVLAEDTRNTGRLLEAHGIRAKVSPYHDHNGARRRPDLIARLEAGATLALVSDAGTPLVSDPGWKLVHEAIQAGCSVVPVPGASAALAGLVASGLPSDRFCFEGFLPTRSAARRRRISELARVPSTLILYESATRLGPCLSDLAAALGEERPAAVSRELTKLFEETRRGTLGSLAEHYADAGPPKGEIVILVGPSTEEVASEADLDTALEDALVRLPVKAAVAEVTEALSLPRRAVYQRALEIRDGKT